MRAAVSAVNRLTVRIIAAVAKEEARVISARTKTALAAAKARGVQLGGKRENAGDLRPYVVRGAAASAEVRQEKAAVYVAELAPIIAELDPDGSMSLGELARMLTAKEVPTPRGGKTWQAVQVQRVLSRMEGAT
jgi:hypothetical protein